jgi:hypothetical protein
MPFLQSEAAHNVLAGSASASGRPIQPTTTPSTDGARRASPDGARGASPAGMAAESMMFGNTGRPLNEDLQVRSGAFQLSCLRAGALPIKSAPHTFLCGFVFYIMCS